VPYVIWRQDYMWFKNYYVFVFHFKSLTIAAVRSAQIALLQGAHGQWRSAGIWGRIIWG